VRFGACLTDRLHHSRQRRRDLGRVCRRVCRPGAAAMHPSLPAGVGVSARPWPFYPPEG